MFCPPVDHPLSTFDVCSHLHSALPFTGDNKEEAVAKALKECLSCVMNCDADTVKKQLKSLFERLDDNHSNRQDTTPYLGRLFIRIYREFPGDVGCFIIYFLNHVVLEPGEAVYLAPNMPHAYLYGGRSNSLSFHTYILYPFPAPHFEMFHNKRKRVRQWISMLH